VLAKKDPIKLMKIGIYLNTKPKLGLI